MPFLRITIRFLAGEYYAAAWPPGPGTVFQSLIAGGKSGTNQLAWSDRHTAALKWIESLDAPFIAFTENSPAKAYRIFVPPNNMDVAAKDPKKSPQSLKAAKEIEPKRIDEATASYFWPVPDESEAVGHLAAIDDLASNLVALGWGVDFACAEATLDSEGPKGRVLLPSNDGTETRQVPVAGTLASLDARFLAFRNRLTKEGVNPSLPEPLMQLIHYRDSSEPPNQRRVKIFTLARAEDSEKLYAVPPESTIHVAAWVRNASGKAMAQEEFLEDWINSYILGHTSDDSLGHRISYLPLPSIGHMHTDPAVRRVLIAEPPGPIDAADREAFDILAIKLSGASLIREGGSEPHAYLQPVEDLSRGVPPLYLRPSDSWSSVTPVVLHGFNVARNSISVNKTEKLLVQAFETAGVPAAQIKELSFQPAPLWPNLPAASAFKAPEHLKKWPRLHVRVEFHGPVAGPIAIGLGRHCGLGVFAGVR